MSNNIILYKTNIASLLAKEKKNFKNCHTDNPFVFLVVISIALSILVRLFLSMMKTKKMFGLFFFYSSSTCHRSNSIGFATKARFFLFCY
jgi:hypothetical protein